MSGYLWFLCGMKRLSVSKGQRVCPNCGRAIVLHRCFRTKKPA